MKLKILIGRRLLPIAPYMELKEGETYEVDSIVQDCYRIRVPMKQRGKFRYALVEDGEGELVD